jgi:hypothetical protein
VLLPGRRVVERTFAEATRFPRLGKNYQRYASTLANLHLIAFDLQWKCENVDPADYTAPIIRLSVSAAWTPFFLIVPMPCCFAFGRGASSRHYGRR